MTLAFICGMLGCLCFGGDWLMIYGDTAHSGSLYWAWLLARGRSVLPRWMAAVNPLTIYAVLSVGKVILPEGAFRIGFTNGLMSESMIIWFAVFIVWNLRRSNHVPQG